MKDLDVRIELLAENYALSSLSETERDVWKQLSDKRRAEVFKPTVLKKAAFKAGVAEGLQLAKNPRS